MASFLRVGDRRRFSVNTSRVHFFLDENTHSALRRSAERNRETITSRMRSVLKERLEDGDGCNGEIAAVVRKAIRDALKPTETALAKAAAKSALASATAMYLGVQVAADLGVAGVVEMHRRAILLAAGEKNS